MVLLIRTIHGLITAFFVSCIVYVYYAGITNQPTLWAYLAMAALTIEGLVVVFNGGDCPLGPLHHRYGDNKAFFELLMPKKMAKRAVPVLGCVALVGFLLLIF